MTTNHTWYAANMGNDHQGLVIDDETGRNVAVTYDKADAPVVAEAPAMAERLAAILKVWDGPRDRAAIAFAQEMNEVRAILQRIEGE